MLILALQKGVYMDTIIEGLSATSSLVAVRLMTGAEIRDEVSAWVTLVGSVAITTVTIGIQIYRLIRDRDKAEKKNKEDKSEEEDTDDE